MEKPPIIVDHVLSVVIRDDSPLIFCHDSPRYRTVKIKLTNKQKKQIALNWIGAAGISNYYEVISKCFLEKTQ